MEGPCSICQKSATNKCSNCHKVFYCSKEHQKQHWKSHKSMCKPVQVKEDKVLGRHLVATKNIKEGEIVFKEKPLIVGPAQITAPICLGCLNSITEKNSKPCDRCGWPVCNDVCQNSPQHKPECDFTASRGYKVNISSFGISHPNYECITTIRCLYQKKANPELWNRLIKLESHCEQRKSTDKWKSDLVQIAKFSRNFFKLDETEYPEDLIMKMCGIVQVNGHEVPLLEHGYVAIYDTTSMLEHNCRANCSKSFTTHGEVLVAAAVPVNIGDNISICYTDPLWGTWNRRHHLQETKFFNCMCARCIDVTELGTMFSTVKCRKSGCTGNVLPESLIIDDYMENEKEDVQIINNAEESSKNNHKTSKNKKKNNVNSDVINSNGKTDDKVRDVKNVSRDWICSECGKAASEGEVQKLMNHIGEDLNAMEKGNSDACLRFLEHYGKFLHPNHFYMTDVTLALAQLIGQESSGGLPAESDERLKLKTDLCKQVAALLEKMVPAEVRGRGGVLFELHAAIADTGRRMSTRTAEGPGYLLTYLMESKVILEKAAKLLQHEPEDLPEGKIRIQAVKNLVDMNTLLTTLHAAADISI